MPSPYLIRPAQIDEAALLTAIALRSKAHWGYSAEFMAAAIEEMTITTAQLTVHTTFVLEQQREARGFYKIREVTSAQVELTDLFLDPPAIGHGMGHALWDHAVTTARNKGYLQMTWESDPNAEGFYVRMGALRVSVVESTVKPGRFLPRMSYSLGTHDSQK